MSYGEAAQPLDFTTFQIACLCGENGHGKSALLDAMTWALWGRSRAKSEDDLIQLGKLDFELPWIVEELTWPDQEELGRRMSLAGLADVAERKDDRPAVEAICLNPMRGGDARLGASVQPALRDLLRNTEMPSRIATRALRMIPGLSSLNVRNAYPGNRPMLSDGLPVAGRTPIEGLFVHGGMGSIGMAAAPATARWLVEAVLSGDGDPKQAWLLPNRFPGWS